MDQTPPPDRGPSPQEHWPAEGYGPQPERGPALLRPDEERLWSVLNHLSIFVLAIIGPLTIMLTLGKRSPYVRHHAVEALNFHLTMAIAMIIIALLSFVIVLLNFLTDSGFSLVVAIIQPVLLFAVVLASIVFAILAAVRAYQGQLYRYPLMLRFVSQERRHIETTNVKAEAKEGYTGSARRLEDDQMDQQQGPQQSAAPPQYSADSRWWWNGQQWIPVQQPPTQRQYPSPPRTIDAPLRESPTVPPAKSRPSLSNQSGQRSWPGRWLYVVSGAMVVAGMLLGVVSVVTFAVGYFSALPRDGPRAVAPGSAKFTLTESGDYVVDYEYQTALNGKAFDTPTTFPPMKLTLTDASGTQVPLEDFTGSFTYQLDSAKGEAVARFHVDTAGTYTLTSEYPAGQEGPQIVLVIGHDPFSTGAAVELLTAIAIAVVGVAIGLVTLVLRTVTRPHG